MRIIALFLILPVGFLFVKSYLSYKRETLDMIEQLVGFFAFLEQGIRSRLAPIPDLVKEYECDQRLKILLSFPEKMNSSRVSCIIPQDKMKTIVSILTDSGEIGFSRLADKAGSECESLSALLKTEREAFSKEERIYPLLALAACAGIFILLI